MPNLNGLELFARIREIDPTARALLLTANHEQFTEGKQIEGQDYLKVITKPISNEKLLAEVDSVLNINDRIQGHSWMDEDNDVDTYFIIHLTVICPNC